MAWPLLLASDPIGGWGLPNGLFQLLPLALIFGIFYFLLFALARKQRKKLQEMLDSLKAGDKVITSGGIYGTIVSVSGEVIRVRIAQNVMVDVARSAITSKQAEEAS